ncbi:class I SAM-dependent methyltransferase [Billgrantia gudaonensis]|uniref:Phospholipid N-methyltransferase n=1 Tax=Billgrantia gudaonensis TaxID=376427 RepID=A0A1G8ZKY5_9GAMM|nr:rRNA adenine N-6-methyltransferase family protein [Halomonas gudaonensis]SDK15772.1 Phospholipid N-methyltransferase [Halomonas gudaonensis]
MTVPDRPAAPARSPERAQLSLFARNFFKHPRMLGSIIPSSSFLVRRLLSRVDWEGARVIVEYGPGVGTITREILRRMHPEATLVVLETNDDFVDFLERALPDPRLQVVKGSAEAVQAELQRLGLPAADHVLAGIPFSTMPAALRERILTDTQAALSAQGSLLIYQFSSRVRSDLQRVFGQVESDFEPFNILPARLFYCRR